MNTALLNLSYLVLGLCLAGTLYAAPQSQIELDEELIAQVGRGFIEPVEKLLDKGANPNARSRTMSALQGATSNSNLELMQLLLDRGANVNAIASDGRSPLMDAVSHRTTKAVELLLDAGAEPTGKALALACLYNRGKCVTLLLEAGALPDAGMTAAAQGGHEKLLKQLIAQGANVNAKSPEGHTALHSGASQGGVEVVRFLLAQGADPNAANNRGETPLHLAIMGDGHLENVRVLLEAKADPSKRNLELVTPVRLAAIRENIPAYQLFVEANGGKEPAGEPNAQQSVETTKQLIDDTLSKDHQTRKQASLALIARGGSIMPEVITVLESQTENGELYDVLTKIGPEAEAALPKLTELLSNQHLVVIARLTMDRIRPGFFAKLPPKARQQAEEALYASLIDPKRDEIAGFFAMWLNEESLFKLLRSQQVEHRSLAAHTLRKIRGQRSTDIEAELMRILLSDEEPHSIRKHAAQALGRSGKLHKKSESALLKILKSSPPYDSNVSDKKRSQRQQLRSLAEEAGRALVAAGPSIIEDLLPLLTPLNNPRRSGAMNTLRQLGPAAVPRLIELLAHQDEAIAISASVTLNRIGRQAVPALSDVLKSDNEQVVEYALSALWWIGRGAQEAIPSIQKVFDSKSQSESTRIAAARTLLKINPQDGLLKKKISAELPTLMRIIAGQDAKLQMWAAEILEQLGPSAERALPVLRSFLADEKKKQRQYYGTRMMIKEAIEAIEFASKQY